MNASWELLGLLALLLAFGGWRAWRKCPAPWPARLAEALLPPLLGVLAFVYWETAVLSTRWVWSACRLAPTLGLFHGYPLYSPADSGPINGWLYGPIAALAWAPAALAGSPLPALAIATVINLLALLVPLLAADGRSPLQPGVPGVLGFLFGAAAMLQVYPTWYMASALNADAIAVGLGAGSCLVLLRSDPASTRLLWLAAVLAVLAAWTKQTEAFLLPAQAGWLWFVYGRRAALRYVGAFAVAMTAATALVCLFFKPADVIFNLWTVPSAHALPGGWHAALAEAVDFGRYTMLLWLPCLLIVLPRARRLATQPSPAVGPGRSVLLFMVVAAVALPLGIMAAIKVGGDRNSVHSVYYLAVAAALTVARVWPVAVARPTGLMAGGILFAVAGVTLLAGRQVAGYPAMAALPKRCLSQEAWQYARENPAKVYFPWDPLATLMADGRMYHFEYGVLDRIYAGLPPDPTRIRHDLPADAQVLIYPRADYPRTMLREYLPEFVFTNATEDWLIHRRKDPPEK
jgi:hypothetical protein